MNNTSSIQVIDRMAGLLQLLAASDSPLTLKQLSLDAGLASSTCFRILASLKQHGFIEQDSNHRYHLGQVLHYLARKAPRAFDLRERARPVMEKLSIETQETVNLSRREGDELVYIERVLSPRAVRADVAVGKRSPLHVTAVGKLILGAMSQADFDAYVTRTDLTALTPHTLSAPKALREHAVDAYRQGLAYEHQESELGLGCIAVLLSHQQEGVCSGLSISAPLDRLSTDWEALLRRSAAMLG